MSLLQITKHSLVIIHFIVVAASMASFRHVIYRCIKITEYCSKIELAFRRSILIIDDDAIYIYIYIVWSDEIQSPVV